MEIDAGWNTGWMDAMYLNDISRAVGERFASPSIGENQRNPALGSSMENTVLCMAPSMLHQGQRLMGHRCM